MSQKETLTIKRTISIKAIVTSTWKEDAENELSKQFRQLINNYLN